jgi:hypothetical protein
MLIAVAIEVESDGTATWTRESGRLRESLLDAMVTLTLTETDTVMLFELPSVRVLQDTAEFRMVRVCPVCCFLVSFNFTV